MKGSVLVAMSGGVDSSVAAVTLQQMGYQVIGITMKLWDMPADSPAPLKGCCSQEDSYNAASVASKFGFPHYTLNLEAYFKREIIDNFISEYRAGRTPNPCVKCNASMKWGALWRKKEELGLDYIATGHYARIVNENDEPALLKAVDSSKDQSYALWAVPYERLADTLLPDGDFTKREIRRKAVEFGLSNAQRQESQEICFIPDNDYPGFLLKNGIRLEPGEIVDIDGIAVGEHHGYQHYTIGQRKGLGGGFKHPMYVFEIDPAQNRIYIGPKESIIYKRIEVSGMNWLTNDIPKSEFTAEVKIRYRDIGRKALVYPMKDDRCSIYFPGGAEAPAPGQSAVIYFGDRVIGGGIIDRAGEWMMEGK
ncbi:tRNA 2-thiouridine(34) synthase MnmA [bacterium]|nr:tRNA 2-thiouridine(34) synthase MnmA [FCB group bacterium]MBL7191286.1 tRNA 2-thiouridine(34) synthase MnmA [bacterium]